MFQAYAAPQALERLNLRVVDVATHPRTGVDFGIHKPAPAKACDRKRLVMHCSSFPKNLAPGYRVGWAAAGRFAGSVAKRKLMSSLAASVPAQEARCATTYKVANTPSSSPH